MRTLAPRLVMNHWAYSSLGVTLVLDAPLTWPSFHATHQLLAQERVAWVRVCNSVRFGSSRNLPPVLKIVTCPVDVGYCCYSMWPDVLFSVQFITGLWASIGVTRSYSSCPFLCTLVCKHTVAGRVCMWPPMCKLVSRMIIIMIMWYMYC